MASQFGPLPPGAAPFGPRPSSPRGLYREFGMPERPLRIHFPKRDPDPTKSKPWYWYSDLQQPMQFCYLAPPFWGIGWMRLPFFSVIKILPIDTQPLRPIPKFGFASLEDAARAPITTLQGLFGRFNFNDDHLWALLANNGTQNQNMPKNRPRFDTKRGLIVARDSKTNINKIIGDAARQFLANYNGDAQDYNANAATNLLNPSDPNAAAGFHYSHVHGRFAVEQPSGPPTTFAQFGQELSAFFAPLPLAPNARYQSTLPASACFNFNTITTDAYAYSIKIGQLDDKKWNLSTFPPKDATIVGNGLASAKSGDYGGVGPEPFPLFNPSF